MSNTTIKVENLSKIYRLGEIGTGTISRDMERWFRTKILKEEDPFLKIGETNDRANKGASDIVYSLRDINFEIKQGDAVGIIGRNGAGKSTLLKILSRVTTPSKGKINIKGRVASLLEVGTGFHPELTGRENIYLNGAILGMRKRDIDRKLEEIIDFSGVERYIDTPVKRFSSGMYVRLAFAVAAHLESEILIVDEVLAVGDAEFQKKCLGKMGDISKGEGRTVLFVSHNMGSIVNLCKKGLVLNNGLVSDLINVSDAVKIYSNQLSGLSEGQYIKHEYDRDKLIEVLMVTVKSATGLLTTSDELCVEIRFHCGMNVDKLSTSIHLNCEGSKVFCVGDEPTFLNRGIHKIEYLIPPNLLNNKYYSIDLYFLIANTHVVCNLDEVIIFQALTGKLDSQNLGEVMGVVRPNIPFTKPIQI